MLDYWSEPNYTSSEMQKFEAEVVVIQCEDCPVLLHPL